MARIFEYHFTVGPMFGIVVVLGLLALGFIIWMLVDAIGRPEADFSSPGAKTGWVVAIALGVVLGFGFLGFLIALAYLFSVRIPARARVRAGRAAYAPPGSYAPPSATPPSPPPPVVAPPLVHCRNCGAKLAAGARFCHSCGTPVT